MLLFLEPTEKKHLGGAGILGSSRVAEGVGDMLSFHNDTESKILGPFVPWTRSSSVSEGKVTNLFGVALSDIVWSFTDTPEESCLLWGKIDSHAQ